MSYKSLKEFALEMDKKEKPKVKGGLLSTTREVKKVEDDSPISVAAKYFMKIHKKRMEIKNENS